MIDISFSIMTGDITAKLGFSGTHFLWDEEKKARADEMVEEHGQATAVLLQYVWQGGARDLMEFMDDYSTQFSYRK